MMTETADRTTDAGLTTGATVALPAAGGAAMPVAVRAEPSGPASGGRAQIVFIAGMHRSGTSCLARAVASLGFALPRDRLPGGPDNPKGHFEPEAVVQLNDRLLADQGWRWDKVTAMPDGAEGGGEPRAAFCQDGQGRKSLLTALDGSYGRARRIVVKDPRLSFVLPLWRRALEGTGTDLVALVALRNPQAVARSLERRNGTDVDLGLLMWCGQTLAALEASRGMPARLVLFPDWGQGTAPGPAAALTALGALHARERRNHDAEATARKWFQAGELQSEGAASGTTTGAGADDAATADLAHRIFAGLAANARCGTMPTVEEIQGHRAEFDGLTRLIGKAERADALRSRAARRGHMAELEQRASEIARIREQLGAAEMQRDAADHGRDAERASARGLRELVRAAEMVRDDATAALEATRSALDERLAALAETERQRDTLAGQLALATETAERQSAAAAALAADQEGLERRLAAMIAEATAAEAARREAEQREVALRDELDASAARLASSDGDLRRIMTSFAALSARYNSERLSILRPVYRNLYSLAGRGLRLCLPAEQVERIKRQVPNPDGIPANLASPPLLAAPGETGDRSCAIRPGAGTADLPDIFVFSIINWDFRTQRPQHLAREMAARGHRVFYVEMDADLAGPSVRDIAPNLYVVRFGARRTGLIATYTGVPDDRQTRLWIDGFHAFCTRIGASVTRQLIVQHPYWWAFLRHLPTENRITFDCMDDLSGFSNTLPHVLEAEADMIRAADRMVVSSEHLRVRHARSRAVTLVRNAADTGHFGASDGIADGARQARFRRIGGDAGINVGYVGAIAEWFDTALVAEVASRCPEMQFHLCGAVTAPEVLVLNDIPNVTLHGEIAYAEVPGFLAAMDVMTIPFRLTPIIEACDPVKFYEHCAAGKPTVATRLPELARVGDLVFRATTAGDFASGLRTAAAAGRDPAFRDRLRRYAGENTWQQRAAAYLDAVLAAPMVSVVVLSFGAADLTLATLHSLTAAGGIYPNLEIIVVDNGSGDAALDRLRAAVSADRRITLVENGANLGFAAGNNVGIAAATGDYVLLLNNDTYVAPGAVSAMVRHLEADAGLGVVGPLTNAIGNEARVEVAYATMEDMRTEMRRVTTGHRGQRTDVQVCAYFCAMFRRSDLASVGPLSEAYGLGMFEDDDHCARFRAAGQRCAVAEDAFVHHHLSASFDAIDRNDRQALFERNRAIYEQRWGRWTPHRYREARPAPSLRVA